MHDFVFAGLDTVTVLPCQAGAQRVSWADVDLMCLRKSACSLRREDTIDDSQMMRQQMAAMGGASAPGADVQKLFDQERQGLELVSSIRRCLDRT